MRITIHILSVLAIVPLVLVLAYFGLVGLMGAFHMTFICWGLAACMCITAFFFRPNDYGSVLGGGQAVHLTVVGLALWFVIATIESPNTDSPYYRPIYFWLAGLLILFTAPFLHWLLTKRQAEQAMSGNAVPRVR